MNQKELQESFKVLDEYLEEDDKPKKGMPIEGYTIHNDHTIHPLKVTELAHGDWVYVDRVLAQMIIEPCGYFKWAMACDYEIPAKISNELWAVELNQYILRLMGFEWHNIGDDDSYWDKKIERYHIRYCIDNRLYVWLRDGEDVPIANLFPQIEYVHQMQHIFNAMGIEFEFKLQNQ